MIPRLDELMELSEAMKEKIEDTSNITVLITVETKEMLNKINEDFFYKVNRNETGLFNPDTDSVVVNINDIKFVYKMDDENTEDNIN